MSAEEETRLVAIYSGGDWYDAGVDHLLVNTDVSFEEARKAYDEWYRTEYLPGPPRNPDRPPYQTFSAWLVSTGRARRAEIEEWDR